MFLLIFFEINYFLIDLFKNLGYHISMKNLWGESSSIQRTRYDIFVKTLSIMLVCAILIPTIYFNWSNIKAWAKDLFAKPAIEQKMVYTPIGSTDFDAVFLRVHQLEVLSKQYNAVDYQQRTLSYLRSCKYNNTQWSILAGTPDETFIKYVKANEGSYNISSFRPTNEGQANETLTDILFTVPATNEQVDFYHMFAVMNVLHRTNNQKASDLAGWGGDLVELMATFKESTETGDALLTTIRNAFNGNASYGFGSTDVCADFDAVNIINIYNASNNKSIASCAVEYYKNLSTNIRKSSFKSSTFSGYTNLNSLKNVIKTRLQSNDYITTLASSLSVNFTTHQTVVDACIQVFAEYIY